MEGASVFLALQNSAFAAAIRESTWTYPAANIGHILALAVFAGAIAVMDVRLLGGFAQAPALPLVRAARRYAVAAFIALAVTGFMLFAADASNLATNRVFQIKLALIVLGLANVFAFERVVAVPLRGAAADAEPPRAARRLALLSIGVWLGVAACGRAIAYF